MCLLTFIPEYTKVDGNLLACGAENNPDGFGFAIHAGREIIHNSGLNFHQIYDQFESLRNIHHGPALFHSRITTHGGTTLDNCHPFQIGRDTQTVMAHNGMLPIEAKGGKSDTRIFAEELFPSWGGAATLNSRKMRKKLSKFASGSKLVFLSANPDVNEDFTIINEKDGHWEDGVWWSNSSYSWMPRRYYGGGTMYTSGWERTTSPTPNESGRRTHITDCSWTDTNGDLIWGELWTCDICDHVQYFDDDNIEYADLCERCDSCLFCAMPRMQCCCYYEYDEVRTESVSTHSVPGYDAMNDIWD